RAPFCTRFQILSRVGLSSSRSSNSSMSDSRHLHSRQPSMCFAIASVCSGSRTPALAACNSCGLGQDLVFARNWLSAPSNSFENSSSACSPFIQPMQHPLFSWTPCFPEQMQCILQVAFDLDFRNRQTLANLRSSHAVDEAQHQADPVNRFESRFV